MPYKRKTTVTRRKRKAYKKAPSKFRASVPRTLQIATKRNSRMTLKFVTNQTYLFHPASTAFPAGQTSLLCFRANSIYQSQLPVSNVVGVWKSQNPAKYSNDVVAGVQQNADGWDEWTSRFQHFCVTGSRISATFEPVTSGAPSIMTTHVSGIQGAVNNLTTSARLNELPYTKRASIVVNTNLSSPIGQSLSATYSARKFEGVTDPNDNSNLRGRFATTTTPTLPGNTPSEQSFFYLAMSPIDPNTVDPMPQGVVRVKIEYVVQLKEPTDTNQIQLATGTRTGEL